MCEVKKGRKAEACGGSDFWGRGYFRLTKFIAVFSVGPTLEILVTGVFFFFFLISTINLEECE